ncbi:endonuclease domain-containing protein [Sphingomonas sp. Y38-1Y]|uniref:endonuclease domain-containing protein n=1 Tax=Sphingomonas sp. Y38-1Y TaxID=3078265 RepID=UPI0028EBCBBA|nr:endonuclease domain-containing protein [Sphingomonas sp. Y38-1Y]
MRDAELIHHAKSMRRRATEPEQRLWLALRGKRFDGVKFRRQKVVGTYIVDFAARDPMIVVELDGDSHAGQIDYDERRTRFLEEQGYRVIRFTNKDVMTNLEGVLAAIAVTLAPLPTLSPEGERAI